MKLELMNSDSAISVARPQRCRVAATGEALCDHSAALAAIGVSREVARQCLGEADGAFWRRRIASLDRSAEILRHHEEHEGHEGKQSESGTQEIRRETP